MDAERRWYGGYWEFTGEHGLLLPVRVVEQGNGCGAGSGGPIEPGGAEFFYSFASKPRRSIAWSGPTLESRTASESRADV